MRGAGWPDVGLFGFAGAALWGVVRFGVPTLARSGWDPFVAFMALSLVAVFVPLGALAFAIARQEGWSGSERLRLRALRRADAPWLVGGLLVLGVGGAVGAWAAQRWGWSTDTFHRPPSPLRGWWVWPLLAVYWPANILGEELAWRGVVLPRLEVRFGRWAWAANAFGWLGVHACFAPGHLASMATTLVVVPFVAQRLRSTWAGVVLHAALSLPGLIAITVGAA